MSLATYCFMEQPDSAYGGNVTGLYVGAHRQRLQGLTHAEHKFCAAALARVRYTCASSGLLRDHAIGPRLKKIMRATEKLRRCLERYCDGYGYYNAKQNVVLSWVELCKTRDAVGDIIEGKVSAKVIDAFLEFRSAAIITILGLKDRGLIDDETWNEYQDLQHKRSKRSY